jgi:hypothetical protein
MLIIFRFLSAANLASISVRTCIRVLSFSSPQRNPAILRPIRQRHTIRTPIIYCSAPLRPHVRSARITAFTSPPYLYRAPSSFMSCHLPTSRPVVHCRLSSRRAPPRRLGASQSRTPRHDLRCARSPSCQQRTSQSRTKIAAFLFSSAPPQNLGMSHRARRL